MTDEKKSRFTAEQIIGFLRQASDAGKLRELESENAKLKKLLAEQRQFPQPTHGP